MKISVLALAVTAGAAMTSIANADLIAHWNFNNSTANAVGAQLGVLNSTGSDSGSGSLTISPGTSFNTISNGTADGVWGTFSGTTMNAVGADPSGGSLVLQASLGGVAQNPVTSNGAYADFTVAKASYSDLSISFAARRTGTGFNSIQISYSTDGGSTFTSLGSPKNAPNGSFGTFSESLAGNGAVNAASSIVFRLTYDGATGGGGNTRLDNLQINGTLIPAPASIALVGLAGLVAGRRRRN